MSFTRIEIAAATDTQIRSFAEGMGIEVVAADTPLTVAAKLAAAWDKPYIMAAAEAPQADMAGTPPVDPFANTPLAAPTGDDGRMQGGRGSRDPKVRLTINQPENLDGKPTNTDVYIGVNGFPWQLKRGVPISVPYRVFLALKNAVAIQVTMEDGVEQHTERPRIPYSVEAMPSAEEIRAWEAEEAKCEVFCPA